MIVCKNRIIDKVWCFKDAMEDWKYSYYNQAFTDESNFGIK